MNKASTFRELQYNVWNVGTNSSNLSDAALAYLEELFATLPDDMPIVDRDMYEEELGYMTDKLARLLCSWPEHGAGLGGDSEKVAAVIFAVLGHGIL